MRIEIKPFTEAMLPHAGQLLARRHQQNRSYFPLLPMRFEEESTAVRAVQAIWQGKAKHGYAAFRDGQMIAYLLGEQVIQSWGRCAYVNLPGYALKEGESITVLQDLYAQLGDDWVKAGVFSHGVYISAAEPKLIEGFFNIGFGKERVDAMVDLRSIEMPVLENRDAMNIRRAGRGDSENLGNLSHIIMEALSNPPYWHPTIPEEYPELKEGWSELADDQEWKVWLALEKERALGCVGFMEKKENETDLLAAPKTVYLSIAATAPETRGRGIATALTQCGLEEARRDGIDICYTNWISSNFLAARFWPRFGFKNVAYRLSKRIDPMISWTRK